MRLATWMDANGVATLALAKKAGVAWRTARDARNGALRKATTARKIAEAIGRGEDGRFVVDPASMMHLGEVA